MKIARLAAVLGTVAVLVTTVLAQPGSADLVVKASFRIKGPGNTFSATENPYFHAAYPTPAIAVESVKAGGTAQYEVKVRNTGSVASGFKVVLAQLSDPPEAPEHVIPAIPVLAPNGIFAKPLTAVPGGYLTPVVAVGKEYVFLLRVTLPKNSPAGHAYTTLDLSTADGTHLDTAWVVTEQPATPPTTMIGVTAKQGSQAWVGSSVYQARISSPAIPGSDTVSFTVRITNNSALRHNFYVTVTPSTRCTKLHVRDANSDVTGNATTGYLATRSLLPHAYQQYTVTFTRKVSPGCGFDEAYVDAYTYGGEESSPYSVMLIAPTDGGTGTLGTS